MAAKTSIEWVRGTDGKPGSSWNPVTGCTKVSAACDHCYAEGLALRFGAPAWPNGFDVTLRPHLLLQPLRWRRPRRIFVASTGDLFHDQVSDSYVAKVFAVMALAKTHTFMILTKRPARMRSLLRSLSFHDQVEEMVDHVLIEGHAAGVVPRHQVEEHQRRWWRQAAFPLPNVWLGTTVEDQRWADIRIPLLLDTPAALRFLSMEPLLGQVNLEFVDWSPLGAPPLEATFSPLTGEWWPQEGPAEIAAAAAGEMPALPRLDWVIAGGESGPRARAMDPAWVRSLRDQCAAAGVPFMFKQAGRVLADQWSATAAGSDPAQWPEDLRVREVPEGAR
ncbi:DUF5131 family protein [Propionicimonas sp.]|uniref:DUF5131 family protein n=1 Tax=Propionicimonas sp. TaxID=1955623 RepID=UPI0017C88916|nr:phage Gp37/Gp68 family protein [Propionicimonas sp.]MBA3019622.1 phage Gp37/Gp68 family protein [Propionicimonas sp.]MBU4208033.1 phage Gp37/Gp68 family protein [Actinomycetota bacterium]MBU4411513.1 phage Gp37/Gp68 family protein [Actinomycetota bacterium]MCG2805741.1 phage Gp37/Gp68 family protein [Propionicimonas sp.]